jgi:Fur family zinc uptake transcriptional regulator
MARLHHHHEHHGSDLAQAAQHALTAAGEQWTDMRADIFAVLATFEKPASAYDIADLVSQKRGKRVAPSGRPTPPSSGFPWTAEIFASGAKARRA